MCVSNIHKRKISSCVGNGDMRLSTKWSTWLQTTASMKKIANLVPVLLKDADANAERAPESRWFL
jgi:hypothetical protein